MGAQGRVYRIPTPLARLCVSGSIDFQTCPITHTQKSQAPMNSVTLTPTHMGAFCTYLTMLYAMCYVHVGEAKQGAESQ